MTTVADLSLVHEHAPRRAHLVGKSERGGTVRCAGNGIDTWKATWKVEPDGPIAQWYEGSCDSQGKLPEKIADHRVGYVNGVIWAEGHPNPEGLAKASELPGAFEQLRHEMEKSVPLPLGVWNEVVRSRPHRGGDGPAFPYRRREGAAGFSRLDITADFETPSQLYGMVLLRAINAVWFQRARVATFGGLGQYETVIAKSPNGKRTLARVYDKGKESGDAAPFRLVRAEMQWQPKGHYRRGVEAIDGAYLTDRFRRKFGPLAKAGREHGAVTVADPIVLCTRIHTLLSEGALKPAQATRMAGTVILDYIAADRRHVPRNSLWRHRRELIDHGLIRETGELTDGPVEIDLAEPFELVAQLAMWE